MLWTRLRAALRRSLLVLETLGAELQGAGLLADPVAPRKESGLQKPLLVCDLDKPVMAYLRLASTANSKFKYEMLPGCFVLLTRTVPLQEGRRKERRNAVAPGS